MKTKNAMKLIERASHLIDKNLDQQTRRNLHTYIQELSNEWKDLSLEAACTTLDSLEKAWTDGSTGHSVVHMRAGDSMDVQLPSGRTLNIEVTQGHTEAVVNPLILGVANCARVVFGESLEQPRTPDDDFNWRLTTPELEPEDVEEMTEEYGGSGVDPRVAADTTNGPTKKELEARYHGFIYDWKDQPEWSEFNKALAALGTDLRVAEVGDTGCDSYCIVVGPDTTPELAQRFYDEVAMPSDEDEAQADLRDTDPPPGA